MDLEIDIQSEVRKTTLLTHVCLIQKNIIDNPICRAEVETNRENKNMGDKGKDKGWDELGLTYIQY